MELVNNLIDLFNSLERPTIETGKGKRFSVISIPRKINIKIGKDVNGAPCVLVRTITESSSDYIAPIFLENLSIEFNLKCLVHQQNGRLEKGNYTVILCREKDSFIIEYFFQIMVTVIELIGEKASTIEIYDALMVVVDLFRSLIQPPKKSVQGLWSELFLISRSTLPKPLLEAWHSTPEDKYDFCSKNLRIEIKSSSQRVRKHHFSLEQLLPPSNTFLLVASVYVERAGGGSSIKDLSDSIRERIANEPLLLLQLDKIISLTLGIGLQNGLSERFDYELAESSLAFFESNVIPSIDPKLPLGVSNVHFISDLFGKPTANIQYFCSFGGIFEAAIKSNK